MGGGTDEGASIRYQHTKSHQAISHNRSSGFSSVVEIAGGMDLRSPQPPRMGSPFQAGEALFGGAKWPSAARAATRENVCRVQPSFEDYNLSE